MDEIVKAKATAKSHALKSITYLDNHSRVSKNPTKVSVVFSNGESFLFDHGDFQKHFVNVSFKINATGKKFEDFKKK
jgi:hypothetical protein